jgi:hypothetical protein
MTLLMKTIPPGMEGFLEVSVLEYAFKVNQWKRWGSNSKAA